MTKGRIALCLVIPSLILLGGWIRARRAAAEAATDPEARLSAAAAHVIGGLDGRVAEALAFARRVRDEGEGTRPPERLDGRLEGFGILRGGTFESWSGTPAEPAEFGAAEDLARVARRGIRTSLLVRTAPGPSGTAGAASFRLEIRTGPARLSSWLATGSPAVAARLAEPGAAEGFEPGPPARLRKAWRGALIELEDRPAASIAARTHARSAAWAGLAFALCALAALASPGVARDGRRAWVVCGLVLAARTALAAGRTFEELLPRSLGTASLYGRGGGLGWLGSPAALAASAWTFYAIAATVSRWASETVGRSRRTAQAVLFALTVAGVAASLALAASLARDARVPVPRIATASPATLLLPIALALVLVGTAETLAALAALRRGASGGAGRVAVTLWLVPLTLAALAHVHRTDQRITEERLRVEFAPLVRDQTARRLVSLTASVGEAASSPEVVQALAQPGSDDPYLAYALWTASDLFHQGFASSLDVYDAAGGRRGHFAFAFPQVGGAGEAVSRGGSSGGNAVEPETVPIGSSMLRVVHAEAPVRDRTGTMIGRVVGHVLEDPSNLPFLPGSAPYLQALGRGAASGADAATDAPDYVLFDEGGHVDLTTVHQPPAPGDALRAAAGAERTVVVEAGDTWFTALGVAEGRRLHLLMMPAPTWLDAAADNVRVLLLGLAILAIAALGRNAGRPGALADLVRGSLRRKLLAAGLVASIAPLIAMALFVRGYIERRGEASLADTAATVVGAAQRVVEDYQSVGEDDPTVPPLRLNDEALSWLRRVVGQEIHLYEGGELAATSKPELFDSGLVLPRLPGEVERAIVRGGRPFVLRGERLGEIPLPVAYAPVDVRGGPADAVIAVPLVLEERASARSVERLVEILLLLTTALVGMLAASSALLARSVATPVRRLAAASRRIAEGDYAARLSSASRDELGSLVADFNRMAGSLAAQRADLIRRRDYIEALVTHATTGVVSTDAAGTIVTINPAAKTLLGGPSGAPRRGERLEAELRRQAGTKALGDALHTASGTDPVEVDVGTDGERARLRLVRVPLPDPAGGDTGSLVLIDDVTSQLRMHQLAAWAEMARAIAHEIKNPLTPIQLSAEHARRILADRGLLPSPELEACLDTIGRQVRELREISGAFSAYAKIPDLTAVPLDPNAFLHDILAPYRVAPPAGIRVEDDFADVPPVRGDKRILARAVINLVENALQAMPDGGVLRLATRPWSEGRVALEVWDTGPGLAPDVRARLFEPYFSTKTAGTGLGLAIARRAVEAHGGTIEADSAGPTGTVFRILLAAAPPA